MRPRTRVLLGGGAVLLLAGLAAFLFLRHLVVKSFPQTSGTLRVSGLHHPVDIRRDAYGVPCIEAADEHDLLFALGFVHAQDRLWQMDLTRRAAQGRLSELFGDATLPFDRMFRIVGIRRIAVETERAMAPESRRRLEAYAAGVNALMTMNEGKFPVEFDMLQYRPDPWEPVHTVMLGSMMAWDLNLSWWTDLTFGAIAERVGLEKALDIFPSWPASAPPIVPASVWRAYATAGRGLLETAQDYRRFQGSPAMQGGSNAWVIAPAKSASGRVILANDTHLQLQSPPRFYEVHLRAPDTDVGGFSLPGTPGIVAGRNARIAWGLTNVMADDADFYIEQIDSTDPARYLYGGVWRPLSVREEEIAVRGDTAATVVIRSTHHGPIVTDIRTMLQKAPRTFAASMRWTGQEFSDPFEAFHRINHADNWEEFSEGVRLFAGPGQNFVYGDVDGNIGYRCGVRLPLRGKQNSTLPLPGWDPSTEWKGYVPFDQLPSLYNPPEGYIATANNKIVDDSYPYHISDLWEPPSRIVRLREVLGRAGGFSAADFERLQNDRFSPHAAEMTPFLLGAFRDGGPGVEGAEAAFEYLRNWNFSFDADGVATALYQQFFVRLLHNIFADELGAELFHDFVVLVNVPIRVAARLVAEGTSNWFDDVRTPEIETRDDIIRRSFREAVRELRERFGPEMKTWRWGELHTVTLTHPFGLKKPLDGVFNTGPFPYGGGSTSLVSGEYSFNAPFAVTVGAAFRQVVDFARPGETRRVLPGGQSGQVFHAHYRDQMPLWVNGAYRTYRPDGEGMQTLRLEPGP